MHIICTVIIVLCVVDSWVCMDILKYVIQYFIAVGVGKLPLATFCMLHITTACLYSPHCLVPLATHNCNMFQNTTYLLQIAACMLIATNYTK